MSRRRSDETAATPNTTFEGWAPRGKVEKRIVEKQFNRWLAAHDAEIRAEALRARAVEYRKAASS